MKTKLLSVLKILCILMLLLALSDNPYGYYKILRWLICSVTGYVAYLSYQKNNMIWTWIFGAVAILFNPVVPVHLDRLTWSVIDLITAGVLLANLLISRDTK